MDRRDDEKKQRLLAALDRGMVMIHLDARRPGVLVPRDLAGEAHLRLNISYRFDPPDLTVGEWGVRCTLSFNGSRFKVAVPWSALFAIRSHCSDEFWMYPDDMPEELLQLAATRAQAEIPTEDPPSPKPGPRAVTPLREIAGDKCGDEKDGDDEPQPPRSRGHLRVIK